MAQVWRRRWFTSNVHGLPFLFFDLRGDATGKLAGIGKNVSDKQLKESLQETFQEIHCFGGILLIDLQKNVMSRIIHTLALISSKSHSVINGKASVCDYSLQTVFVLAHKVFARLHRDFGSLLLREGLQVFEVGRLPCHHFGLELPPQILDWVEVRTLAWPL